MLYGKVGTGKTTMMKALANLLRQNSGSYDVAYCTATSFVEQFTLLQEDKASRYYDYAKAKVLCIDDLGSEPVRYINYGMERTPILDVLYHRYDMQQLTIISSNLEDQELRDRYGERFADRMAESYDRLYYSGESYRKR